MAGDGRDPGLPDGVGSAAVRVQIDRGIALAGTASGFCRGVVAGCVRGRGGGPGRSARERVHALHHAAGIGGRQGRIERGEIEDARRGVERGPL